MNLLIYICSTRFCNNTFIFDHVLSSNSIAYTCRQTNQQILVTQVHQVEECKIKHVFYPPTAPHPRFRGPRLACNSSYLKFIIHLLG